jgi:alpha-ketoglutarate-dependent taurine dioxygenase
VLPPPAVHPLVRTHPENGRKFLYLNPVRIEAILGMEEKDALALVAELMAHATQKRHEYRRKWIMRDVVIWDDRSVCTRRRRLRHERATPPLPHHVQDDLQHWIAEGPKTLEAAPAYQKREAPR